MDSFRNSSKKMANKQVRISNEKKATSGDSSVVPKLKCENEM